MKVDEAGTSKAGRTRIRTRKGFREYTYLGCPLTRNRSAWCFRLCAPDGDGKGQCGRVAPHGLKGRTQVAIEGHRKRLQLSHFEKLERMRLGASFNESYI